MKQNGAGLLVELEIIFQIMLLITLNFPTTPFNLLCDYLFPKKSPNKSSSPAKNRFAQHLQTPHQKIQPKTSFPQRVLFATTSTCLGARFAMNFFITSAPKWTPRAPVFGPTLKSIAGIQPLIKIYIPISLGFLGPIHIGLYSR